MATDDDNQEAGFNPKRRLCPDGACVGVIGADGKCTVCGTSDGGGANPEALADTDPGSAGDDLAGDDPTDSDDLPSADAEQDAQGEGFDPKRRLCSDGTCVGVIGADHRCSVCGKPADG